MNSPINFTHITAPRSFTTPGGYQKSTPRWERPAHTNTPVTPKRRDRKPIQRSEQPHGKGKPG